MQLVIGLDRQTVSLLRILGDPREVILTLIDHAQQGVYRPGAWERKWLEQVFGNDWQEALEADPAASWRQRPIAADLFCRGQLLVLRVLSCAVRKNHKDREGRSDFR